MHPPREKVHTPLPPPPPPPFCFGHNEFLKGGGVCFEPPPLPPWHELYTPAFLYTPFFKKGVFRVLDFSGSQEETSQIALFY